MTFADFSLPATTINGYLWDTMKQIEPTFAKKYGNKIPFFPLSDSAAGDSTWDNNTYVIYDRMLRLTRHPFPYIKREHTLYYVKGREIDTLQWGLAIQHILDRMDDAAQDINDWNRAQAVPAKVYFHNLIVSQADSGDMGSPSATRDFSDRPFYITKFIVDAQYHFTEPIESILA
jgi:hypothetical protein